MGQVTLLGVLGNGLMGVTTGVLGNVATSAIAWGLDSVFGLQVGQQAKTQAQITQLTGVLTSINGELTTIGREIGNLTNEVSAVNAALQGDYQGTISIVLSTAFTQAAAIIASNWTAYQKVVGANQSVTSGNLPAAGTAEDLMKTILNPSTGVEPQIVTMVALLMPQATGVLGSNGLLDNWTTIQIQNVTKSGAPLEQAYNVLLTNFLSALTPIYQGMCLNTAALVCEASQNFITQNPGDLAGAQKAGQQAGINYLSGNTAATTSGSSTPMKGAAPILAQLSQFFVQCAHRLALSQYMRINPNVAGATFMPPPKQAKVQAILASATLADILITDPGAAYFLAKNPGQPVPAGPGIVVVGYNRPSQIATGGGPSLQPSPSYAASSGKVFALEYGYAENWYKVCDYTDSNYSTLAAFENSTIAIVDYRWPVPAPASPLPTQAVGTQGVFAQTFWAWYDTTTLLQVDAPGPNTVAMAFGFDWSAIYDNLYFPAPTQWSLGNPPGFNWDLECIGQSSQPSPNGNMAWTFSVGGAYSVPANPPPPTFTMSLTRYLAIQPTAVSATLYFFGSASFNYSATDNNNKLEPQIPAALSYELWTWTGWPMGQIPFTLFSGSVGSIQPTTGITDTWNGMSNMSGIGINPAQSNAFKLTFQVTVQGLHQTDGVVYGASQQLAVTGSWVVDSATNIAWQQPTIDIVSASSTSTG